MIIILAVHVACEKVIDSISLVSWLTNSEPESTGNYITQKWYISIFQVQTSQILNKLLNKYFALRIKKMFVCLFDVHWKTAQTSLLQLGRWMSVYPS